MADYTKRGRVGVIQINNPPLNLISEAVKDGIAAGLEKAITDTEVHCILLCANGKNFSCGADLKDFAYLSPKFGPVQRIVDQVKQLEACSKPVVAALQGTALGGGFEYTLACHYRIAHQKSRLLFPEIFVGLIPGALGTQNLPRISGLKVALEVIVDRKVLSADEAHDAGILDKIVDGDIVEEGIKFAESVADLSLDGRRTSHKPIKDADQLMQLTEATLANVMKKNKYTLAHELGVKAIQAAVESATYEEGVKKEREYFITLNESKPAAALQYAFFCESDLPKWSVPALVNHKSLQPQEIKSAAVIGGGTMGAGIVICILNAGIPITHLEKDQESLDKSLARIKSLYMESVKLGKCTENEVTDRLDLLKPTLRYNDLKEVDLVVEATYENMELKRHIFSQLDQVCSPDAILCTNTSTLDIDQIAEVTSRPENVMGTHFFNPSHYISIVENVRSTKTSPQTITNVMSFCTKIGKSAVLVGNCFGFVGNRMFFPLIGEALFLVEEGALPDQVDKVMEHFGFPLGPFKVLDMIGLDIFNQITQEQFKLDGLTYDPTSLYQGDRRVSILSDELLLSKGRLGRKTGSGWYKYDKAHAKKAYVDESITEAIHKYSIKHSIKRREITDQEIKERCLMGLINEGFKVLEEGMASRPGDIDVLWMTAFGWPRHTGGPMFYSMQEGLQNVYEKVNLYRQNHSTSPHWKPSTLLTKLHNMNVPIHRWISFISKL